MGKSGKLKVLMNGRLVGHLTSSSKGVLSYKYDSSWLEFDGRRPVSLSLPLSTQTYSGSVVENYFDNLLPDSMPIRNRLQARVGAESVSAFDLLARIGRDCVGALQLVPEGEQVDVKKVTAIPFSDSDIEKSLSNYKAQPLGVDIEADFRISVAGAQEKTAFLLIDEKWHKPIGATPTSHIFKLPIGELGQSGLDLSESVENEWLCQQLIRKFGVPIAETRMLSFGEQKVLAVERFDRKWAKDSSWLMRLPQEDICQAMGVPSHLKYESDGGPGMKDIMGLLLGSAKSYDDRAIFLQTQLLFWMLGAIDGHAKNFSIFHLPSGLYILTPMYDVMSIYPLVDSKQIAMQKVGLAMAVFGKHKHYKLQNISRRHWLDTAKKCKFPKDEMEIIIEKCCDTVGDCIATTVSELPDNFPAKIAESIFFGLERARDRLIKEKKIVRL